MARGLAPAYVRLGGPQSNSYTFKRALFLQDGLNSADFTFSEAHWVLVQQWAEKSGLEIIACLALQQTNNGEHASSWDPRNVLDLISFSDHMGYNMSWQLGYECQTRCDISGGDLGKNVMRLRNMLDAFPRYSKSIIAGPDVMAFRNKQQQQYLQDYLNAAGNSLSAITWHPNFTSITLDSDGVTLPQDNLIMEKDSLYKIVGRSMAKKPLWIAESKAEDCKKQFLGALIWLRRLGNAAKLGVQVVMRQPDMSDLFQPSPDYWVSVLHKTLVGREVLDVKVTSGNKSHVNFYCQCTRSSSKYERGSLTIFGLNLASTKIVANIRGLKMKNLHKYILMPGYDATNRMFAETVLLNNEPLNLINENLPELVPAVSSSGKDIVLKLPSGGIGFWVVTGTKIKSCMDHEDSVDKTLLKRLTKRLEEAEVEEDVGHEEENDQDAEVESMEERRTHVKQKKKKRRYRHSEEEDEERKIRKIDGKKELEKLEKLLKRRDNEEKKPHGLRSRLGSLTYDESSEKKKNTSVEEEEEDREAIVLRRTSGKPVSGEEIKIKLDEYRNRMTEHENRIKHQEELEMDRSEREKGRKLHSRQDDVHSSKDMDMQKAVEALRLISTVENVVKSLEKNELNAKIDTLNREYSYGESTGLTNRTVDMDEDILLGELLKTEKIKRTAIPSAFEERLETIYRLFTEDNFDKVRREKDVASVEPEERKVTAEELEGEVRSRNRRDLEKLFGDDPLGLRKDSFFRKRSKNEEVKERRLERKNRKKEREESRRDMQSSLFESRVPESNENNFYGFANHQPPKDFPQGDVFLSTGNSSEEKENDYEYIQDDDEGSEGKNSRGKMKSRSKSSARKVAEPDDTWIEEENDQLYHAPHEFFEDTRMPVVHVKENLKNYGELWEAEALRKEDNVDEGHRDNDRVAEEIVKENDPNEYEDKKAKETAVKRLMKYYDNTRTLKGEPKVDYDYVKVEKTGAKENGNSRSSGRNREQNSNAKGKEDHQQHANGKKLVKMIGSEEDEEYVDFESTQFRDSENSFEEEQAYEEQSTEVQEKASGRARRGLEDLDSMFNEEMIYQDDGNLKDCKCRTIRGIPVEMDNDCKKMKSVEEDEDRESTKVDLKSLRHAAEIRSSSSNSDVYSANVSTNVEPISSRMVSTTKGVSKIRSGREYLEEPIEGIKDSPTRMELVPEVSKTVMSKESIRNEILKRNSDPEDDAGEVKILAKESKMIRSFQEPDGNFKKVETHMRRETATTESSFPLALGRMPEALQVLESSTSSNSQIGSIRESADADRTSSTEVFVASLQESYKSTINEKTKIISGHEPLKKSDKNVTTDFKKEADREIDARINVESVSTASKENTLFKVTEPKVVEIDESSSLQTSQQTGSINSTVTKEAPETYTITTEASKTKTASKAEELSKMLETKVQTTRSENLFALKRETESKKVELKKAPAPSRIQIPESSARPKSMENAWYQEYQKKRMEKLGKLKEKLQAKRTKILQQYRDELLDALSKCNNEMERNLKKREIWEELKKCEEFRDFTDPEKLVYIMANAPIDYNHIFSQNDEENLKNLKYVPEVEIIRPLHEARKQKVDVKSHLRHFREPGIMQYIRFNESISMFDPKSIQEELSEETNVRNDKAVGRSFYAVVESLENPRIFDRDLFYDLRSIYDNDNAKIIRNEEYNEDNWRLREKEGNNETAEGSVDPEVTLLNNFKIIDAGQTPFHRLSKRSTEKSTSFSERLPFHSESKSTLKKDTKKETHSYVGLKDNSREEFNKNRNKPFRMIKEDDHYKSVPTEDTKINERQESRKKNLKITKHDDNKKDEASKETRHVSKIAEEHAYRREYSRNLNSEKKNLESRLKRTFEDDDIECKHKTVKKSSNKFVPVLREETDASLVEEKRPQFVDQEPEETKETRREQSEKKTPKKNIQGRNTKLYDDKDVLTKHQALLIDLPKQYLDEINVNKDEEYQTDEGDTLELDDVLNSDKYELLMLIPVKSHKHDRQRRQIGNEIQRSRGDEDLNEIWAGIVQAKKDEDLLREYVVKREEIMEELENSRKTMNEYFEQVQKLKSSEEKIDLEAKDSRITDERSSNENGGLENETEASWSSSVLGKNLPKIEIDVIGERGKETDLTESLENFIDEFEGRFDDTLKKEQKKLDFVDENVSTKETTSHDIFHTVLTNVKKFFHFLSGVTHIFYGH